MNRQIITSISAVYLFNIRQVAFARFPAHYDIIDKSLFIAKYGYTKNLVRRSKEHARMYGPSIELANSSFVAPLYLREAENELRRSFKGAGILHADSRLLSWYNVANVTGRELVVFPNDAATLGCIHDIYREIEMKYAN